MNEILLVDTSFLVALVDGRDVLHGKARDTLKKIETYYLIFTDVVYTETISVLARRIRGRRTVPEGSSILTTPFWSSERVFTGWRG